MTSKITFGSLGIRKRLFLGFFLLATPIFLGVFLFLYEINKVEKFTEQMSTVLVPTRTITANMGSLLIKSQLLSYEWLLTGNESTKSDLLEIWKELKDTQAKMVVMESKWGNKELIAKWAELRELLIPLESFQSNLLAIQPSYNEAVKQIIQKNEEPLINKVVTLLTGLKGGSKSTGTGLFDMLGTELSTQSQTIMYDLINLRYMAYGLLVLIIILAIIVSLITSRKIIGPIQQYSKHSGKVASGDLTQRLVVERSDEVGALGHDLNSMTDSLANMTKKISSVSHEMTLTLDEVKLASEMQSTGISEQASSINEITASLEEIDKSTNQTMEKAKILGDLAEETSKKGQLGLDSVEQTIAGMNAIRNKVQTIATAILELSNQTQQVGEITSVVNTLALQSKMLALNASIEASKAGEAGKGFAVVASEVKNLAEQSEQSTLQVQKILEDIRHGAEKAVLVTEEGTKGVDQGMGLVEQMGEIVRSLTEAVNETLIASQQIEAAVRQEGLGIEQITVGMNEINQVTSSFVHTVKQTTDSINKLSDMAKSFKAVVDVYKV